MNEDLGHHYRNLKIEPITYIEANNLGFFEGNIIKYVSRWKFKDGIPDLEKARYYLEKMIEIERAKSDTPQ